MIHHINADYENTYIEKYVEEERLRKWSPLSEPAVPPKHTYLVLGGEACAWDRWFHFEWSLPTSIALFGDRLWNHAVCEHDSAYKAAVTRLLLSNNLPDGFEIFSCLGGILLPLDNLFMAHAEKSDRNISECRKVLQNIQTQNEIQSDLSETYLKCLDWLENFLGGTNALTEENSRRYVL